jgi:asparagine synthase (glutamine-hydrolysing)
MWGKPMCGIAGILTKSALPVSRDLLIAMRDTMTHRGPDDAGIWLDGPIGLAHRRLSILDPSPAGHQPMSDPSGDVWIVYNGELYNYPAIRRLCEDRGVLLRSHSDTETLLHLWRFFAEKMVEHMRGMFAFGLWDRRERVLLLGRDRFGQKPLYYADLPDRFLFASELKALRVDPTFPPMLDERALRDYFAVGYVPDPASIYSAARKLPAAHYLLVRPDTGSVEKPHQYWRLEFQPDSSIPADAWKERLEHKLTETVACHMISDVPLGGFLSGGVDSSTVVALMTRASSRPVKTFSIGFEEEAYSELPHARAVAKHLGADHTDLIVRPDKCALVEKLFTFYDEPFADSSALPTFLVSELARTQVTVSLSGDGGDELFGGYNRYMDTLEDIAKTWAPAWSRGTIFAWLAHRWPPGLRGRSRIERIAAGRQDGNYVERTLGLFGRQLAQRCLRPELAAGYDPFLRWEQILARQDLPLTQRMQMNDIESYLPGDILVKVDRASMAVSLESRAPLLDHELAELAARIPTEYLVDRRSGKKILKRIARGLVPASAVDRKKMGFGIPIDLWFRAELRPILEDLLLDRPRTGDLYRPGAVASILEQHWRGELNWSYVIWTMLALEIFWRKWQPSLTETLSE